MPSPQRIPPGPAFPDRNCLAGFHHSLGSLSLHFGVRFRRGGDVGMGLASDLPQFAQTLDVVFHLAIARVDPRLPVGRQIGNDLSQVPAHLTFTSSFRHLLVLAYLISSQKIPAMATKPKVKTSVRTYGMANR